MHSNFNDLKTKTMEYKDLVKHHTQLIKDKNDNKWEVIETSDLEEICEAYHQRQLKLLGIADVSTRTLDENDKDVYCIGCGMDEQDGTYKYHRTVANGDEWYCTNCKDYHLH